MGMTRTPDIGIIDKPSAHSVEQTVAKLKNILQSTGVTLFALIDHSAEAENGGDEDAVRQTPYLRQP
jgi:uncharacterized protein (DUF302 family)